MPARDPTQCVCVRIMYDDVEDDDEEEEEDDDDDGVDYHDLIPTIFLKPVAQPTIHENSSLSWLFWCWLTPNVHPH